jgi:hypothetical protein
MDVETGKLPLAIFSAPILGRVSNYGQASSKVDRHSILKIAFCIKIRRGPMGTGSLRITD